MGSADLEACLQFNGLSGLVLCISKGFVPLRLYLTRLVQSLTGLDMSMLKLLATQLPTSKVLSVLEPWRNTCLESKCRLLLFFGKAV